MTRAVAPPRPRSPGALRARLRRLSSAHRVLGRAIFAALVLASAPACAAWRTHAVPPSGAMASGTVRVVLANGAELRMRRVVRTGDSLIGEAGRPARRRAVALGDVARVERREPSTGRTAALVASLVLAAAAIGAIVLVLQAYSPIA